MKGSYISTQLLEIGHTHDTSSFMSLKNKNGKSQNKTSLHFEGLLKAAIPESKVKSSPFYQKEKLHSILEQENKLLQELLFLFQLVEGNEEIKLKQSDGLVGVVHDHGEGIPTLLEDRELMTKGEITTLLEESVAKVQGGNLPPKKEDSVLWTVHTMPYDRQMENKEDEDLSGSSAIFRDIPELEVKLDHLILQPEDLDASSLAEHQMMNQQVMEEFQYQPVIDQEISMKQTTLISNLLELRMDNMEENSDPYNQLIQIILSRLDELLITISSEEYRVELESDHLNTLNSLSTNSMFNQYNHEEIEGLLQQVIAFTRLIDQNLSSDEGIHSLPLHADRREHLHDRMLFQQMNLERVLAQVKNPERIIQDQEGRKNRNYVSSLSNLVELKDVEILKHRLLQWSQIREKLENIIASHKDQAIHSEKAAEKKLAPVYNKFSVLQQSSNYVMNNSINTEQVIADRSATGPSPNNETSAPAARAAHLFEDLKPIIRNYLQFIRQDDVQQIRIRLIPEHLGHLDIRITAQDGKISATLLTSNYMAKEALELQIQQLRIALTQQGINLDKIDISQQAHHHSNFEQHESHEQSAQHARKEAAEEEKYEDIEEEVLALLEDLDEEQSIINFMA